MPFAVLSQAAKCLGPGLAPLPCQCFTLWALGALDYMSPPFWEEAD